MAHIKQVRITQTPQGTYQLGYVNHAGKQRRLRVGKEERYAQRLRLKFEAWLLEGKDPEREMERDKVREAARSVTIQQFYPVFMEQHGQRQSPSMQRLYRERFQAISRYPELNQCPLSQLTKSTVTDYMQKRMSHDGVSPATVNREASILRTMCSHALERDLLDKNPLRGIRLFKEAGKRLVRVTQEEIGALRDEIHRRSPMMAQIVEFAVYTGMRKTSILELRVEQVAFRSIVEPTGQLVELADVELKAKGRSHETKILGGPAVSVLRSAIGHRLQGYAFPTRQGNRYKGNMSTFKRVVRLHRLTVRVDGKEVPLRWHDLRHITATWGQQAGINPTGMQTQLGHTTRAMTDWYTAHSQEQAALEMQQFPVIPKPPK
jgi:integrase